MTDLPPRVAMAHTSRPMSVMSTSSATSTVEREQFLSRMRRAVEAANE
jgi:hypothetical protein